MIARLERDREALVAARSHLESHLETDVRLMRGVDSKELATLIMWLVQEVTLRLPGRIDLATTTFASASDLASAMRRAAAAHGKHEKRHGHDVNWPDWYAAYMAAEQAGTDLPR
jgi:hypothetical protein